MSTDQEAQLREPNIKLLLIGDGSVGKSSLLRRYVDNSFDINMKETVGLDFRVKKVLVDHTLTKVSVWDTAGQEKYRAITQQYYKGADGIILVFDLSQRETFNQLQRWIQDIFERAEHSSIKMLVANKKDLIECVEDPVSEEEINKYCEKLNLKVIYTSAKTGENVETAFTEIITMVIENKRQTINLADESGSRKDQKQTNKMSISKTATTHEKSLLQQKSNCCN